MNISSTTDAEFIAAKCRRLWEASPTDAPCPDVEAFRRLLAEPGVRGYGAHDGCFVLLPYPSEPWHQSLLFVLEDPGTTVARFREMVGIAFCTSATMVLHVPCDLDDQLAQPALHEIGFVPTSEDAKQRYWQLTVEQYALESRGDLGLDRHRVRAQ